VGRRGVADVRCANAQDVNRSVQSTQAAAHTAQVDRAAGGERGAHGAERDAHAVRVTGSAQCSPPGAHLVGKVTIVPGAHLAGPVPVTAPHRLPLAGTQAWIAAHNRKATGTISASEIRTPSAARIRRAFSPASAGAAVSK
jgi:hypothetical protein